MKSNNRNFKNAINFVDRCLKSYLNGKIDTIEKGHRLRFRVSGAGRKQSVPELRQALFDWFVDSRSNLQGRLPIMMLRGKCEELYSQYVEHCASVGSVVERMEFSDNWIQGWCKEFQVSLRKPNKVIKLDDDTKKRRIILFV